MSENKWTPGPYERKGRSIYALEDAGHRMKTNRFYAHVDRSGSNATEDELEAVAQLWVAAPAMAEALRRARHMLQSVAGDIEDGYSLADLRGKYVLAVLGARDSCDAALSLARGEAK